MLLWLISRVFFSDMKTGKCSSVVEARLLRFWEARNVKRGGELSLSVLSLHIFETEKSNVFCSSLPIHPLNQLFIPFVSLMFWSWLQIDLSHDCNRIYKLLSKSDSVFIFIFRFQEKIRYVIFQSFVCLVVFSDCLACRNIIFSVLFSGPI